jgi:hypothetical protein
VGSKKNDMTNQRAIEIDKPLALKLIELRDALLLIRDCTRHIREGRPHYLPALAGQMRGLLFDKDTRAEPRLQQVAESLGIELALYCADDAEEMARNLPVKDSLMFLVSGFPISANRQSPAQRVVSIDAFKDFKLLSYKEVTYTVRTFVEWFANKSGGAHYSKKIPRHFAELLTVDFHGLANIAQFFVQLGEAVVELGHKVLQAISDQEIHMLVGVPRLPKEVAHIVDVAHPAARMRTILYLTELGALGLLLQGMNRESIRVHTTALIDWSDIRHICYSVTIDESLNTHVWLYVDGEVAGHVQADFPILSTADWQHFDVLYNRKHEQTEGQPFEFFWANMLVYAKTLSVIDRAKLLVYNDEQRADEGRGLLFPSGAYGRSPPGGSDISVEGGHATQLTNAEFRAMIRPVSR